MQSWTKTVSGPEHLVVSITSSSGMMIPSREEGHQVSLDSVTSSAQQQQQQPLTSVKQVSASHRQSWHDLSQYVARQTVVPHSHQECTTMRPPNFTDFSGGCYHQDQSLPRNQWTGFEPINAWSHGRTTYHRHSGSHDSMNSNLSVCYANYYLMNGEQRFLQRQNTAENYSGTSSSSMFFSPQSEYTEYPSNWNSQPTSLPTPVDINQQGLIHSSGIFQVPTETGALDIGGDGNATSGSVYRPTQGSCKSYNDDEKVVVALSSSSSSLSSAAAAAATTKRIVRRRSDDALSAVNRLSGETMTLLTSSLTSSSQSQRPKAVTSECQNASSSSSGKTRTREKYRTVYTEQQKLELEKEYEKGTFINAQRKADIAKEVGLSERQVKIWFQNRRAKDRRIRRKAEGDGEGEEEEDDDDDEDCVSTRLGFPVHSSVALHQDVHSTVDSDSMLVNCNASYNQPIYEYLRTDRRH